MTGNGRFVKGDPRINREGAKLHKRPEQVKKQVDILAKWIKGAGKKTLLKELRSLKGKDFVNAYTQLLPFYQSKLNSIDASVKSMEVSIPPDFWRMDTKEQKDRIHKLQEMGVPIPDLSKTWIDDEPKEIQFKPLPSGKPNTTVESMEEVSETLDDETIDIEYQEDDLSDEALQAKGWRRIDIGRLPPHQRGQIG